MPKPFTLTADERNVLEVYGKLDAQDSDGSFAPYDIDVAMAAGRDAAKAYRACKALKKRDLITCGSARQGSNLASAPSYWITAAGKELLAELGLVA